MLKAPKLIGVVGEDWAGSYRGSVAGQSKDSIFAGRVKDYPPRTSLWQGVGMINPPKGRTAWAHYEPQREQNYCGPSCWRGTEITLSI